MYMDLINLGHLKKCLLYIGITILVLFFQNTVFVHITPLGVYPMFVPAYIVAVGIFEGGLWGGFLGLLAGLICDGDFSSNTVMFTILFPAVGFFSGMLSQFVVNKKLFSYIFVSLAAIVIVTGCQLIRPLVISDAHFKQLVPVAGLQVLWSMPFAAVLYFPVRKMAGIKFK